MKNQPTELSLDQRLEINNIVNRLLDDGQPLSMADARRLIELIPPQASRGLSFSAFTRSRGNQFEGQTNLGPFRQKDGGERKETTLGALREWRAGLYKLTHANGMRAIGICRVMDVDPFDDDRMRYLKYGRKKRPIGIYKDVTLTLPLPFVGRLQISLVAYRKLRGFD